MKHPVANITVEGAGHNPYSVVSEGREAFIKRMEEDGHYQRMSDGLPTTAEQRAKIATAVYDKAVDYVTKHPSDTVTLPAAAPKTDKKDDAKK
jgi:hypothetical protein